MRIEPWTKEYLEVGNMKKNQQRNGWKCPKSKEENQKKLRSVAIVVQVCLIKRDCASILSQ